MPHIPQSATEKLIIARLFEVEVFMNPFPVLGVGSERYEARFIHGPQKRSVDGELVASPLWDEYGRYRCYVEVYHKEEFFTMESLLDGDVLPVMLWIEEGWPGVQLWWAMPENHWTHGQSNQWPSPPVLFMPKKEETHVSHI